MSKLNFFPENMSPKDMFRIKKLIYSQQTWAYNKKCDVQI